MSNSIEKKIRPLIETLISTFLFLLQRIPVVGPWMGPMFFPLATYMFSLFWCFPEFRDMQFWLIFLDPRFTLSRGVIMAGFIIFLVAFIQLLKGRGKLVTGGLYSAVRHPQYLGLIVMTYGTSVMCVEWVGLRLEFLCIWLVLATGYLLLAAYEEKRLLIDYSEEYQRYRLRTPFIFPIPRINKIPEFATTLAVAFVMAFLLDFYISVKISLLVIGLLNRLPGHCFGAF